MLIQGPILMLCCYNAHPGPQPGDMFLLLIQGPIQMVCCSIAHPVSKTVVMLFCCSSRALRLLLCCSIVHSGPYKTFVMLFFCSTRTLRLLLFCSIAHPGPQADAVIMFIQGPILMLCCYNAHSGRHTDVMLL